MTRSMILTILQMQLMRPNDLVIEVSSRDYYSVASRVSAFEYIVHNKKLAICQLLDTDEEIVEGAIKYALDKNIDKTRLRKRALSNELTFLDFEDTDLLEMVHMEIEAVDIEIKNHALIKDLLVRLEPLSNVKQENNTLRSKSDYKSDTHHITPYETMSIATISYTHPSAVFIDISGHTEDLLPFLKNKCNEYKGTITKDQMHIIGARSVANVCDSGEYIAIDDHFFVGKDIIDASYSGLGQLAMLRRSLGELYDSGTQGLDADRVVDKPRVINHYVIRPGTCVHDALEAVVSFCHNNSLKRGVVMFVNDKNETSLAIDAVAVGEDIFMSRTLIDELDDDDDSNLLVLSNEVGFDLNKINNAVNNTEPMPCSIVLDNIITIYWENNEIIGYDMMDPTSDEVEHVDAKIQ